MEVPLNDSLTSFRIVAVATGGVGQFGTGSTEIRSTQDIMLLSGLPPLVRQGDALPAQFTLRNTTDRAARRSRCAARSRGSPHRFAPQTVALAPGEARVDRVADRGPFDGGDAALHRRGERRGRAERSPDASAQHVLPAVPVRTLQATLLRWERPTCAVPRAAAAADALPDRGGIDVAASPRSAARLEPLRKWLRDYPYSCLEQKVSIAVGLGDDERWRTIGAALPSYVDGDGLLKFFPTMPTRAARCSPPTCWRSASRPAGRCRRRCRSEMVNGLRGFVDGSIRRDSAAALPPDLALRKLAAIEALARVGSAEPASARQHHHRAQPVADVGRARLVEHPAARAGDRGARRAPARGRADRARAPRTCRARRWASRPSAATRSTG